MQRPSIIDEETKRSTPVTKRPPPFFRRRSSSLPQLLADSLTSEASGGKVGQADYWHTGNLQQLIDSRNQEEDVEEGILEVQVSIAIVKVQFVTKSNLCCYVDRNLIFKKLTGMEEGVTG